MPSASVIVLSGSLGAPQPNLRACQSLGDCSTIMSKSGFHQIAHIL